MDYFGIFYLWNNGNENADLCDFCENLVFIGGAGYYGGIECGFGEYFGGEWIIITIINNNNNTKCKIQNTKYKMQTIWIGITICIFGIYWWVLWLFMYFNLGGIWWYSNMIFKGYGMMQQQVVIMVNWVVCVLCGTFIIWSVRKKKKIREISLHCLVLMFFVF